ncbi:MAG: 2-oxo acid dehydrogenase subunit E2 [Alphaproteobacteria bacterium]
MAQQNNVSLSNVNGTGANGRIMKSDVLNAPAGGSTPSAPIAPAVVDDPYQPEHEKLPVSTMRGVIAKRLTESKQSVPHFYLTADVEIDELMKVRKELNDKANGDYKISVNDMVLKAVGVALNEVPDANVAWAGDVVKQFKSSDISVAVAIEGGLITPVVRNAETKGLVDISNEMKELAGLAKSGSLKPEQYQGGTISVSNLGMYGVDNFNAIVNPPQAVIVAIGAGKDKPVVKNGSVDIATVMTLTISVDHRAVDGAVGGLLLKAIKEALEDPKKLVG